MTRMFLCCRSKYRRIPGVFRIFRNLPGMTRMFPGCHNKCLRTPGLFRIVRSRPGMIRMFRRYCTDCRRNRGNQSDCRHRNSLPGGSPHDIQNRIYCGCIWLWHFRESHIFEDHRCLYPETLKHTCFFGHRRLVYLRGMVFPSMYHLYRSSGTGCHPNCGCIVCCLPRIRYPQ